MKKSITFICLGIFLLSWIGILGLLYDKGKTSKALIYAEIPKETINFLDSLSSKLDLFIRHDPNTRPEDWKNKRNYGEDPQTGLKKIEDDNFIVYFDKNGNEIPKAEKTLRWANDAIPELADMLGKYPYPADVKDRKLPIYLAATVEEYYRIVSILLGAPYDDKNSSAGVYISSYSRLGNRTIGIVINSIVWRDDTYAHRVLWHEINHYGYFTLIEYDKVIKPYMWFYEGLAEYFSHRRILKLTDSQIQQCSRYTLSSTFPNTMANYWGGESVYRFIEDEYGKENAKSFIQRSYSNTVDYSSSSTFNKNLNHLENEWKQWLDSQKGK